MEKYFSQKKNKKQTFWEIADFFEKKQTKFK